MSFSSSLALQALCLEDGRFGDSSKCSQATSLSPEPIDEEFGVIENAPKFQNYGSVTSVGSSTASSLGSAFSRLLKKEKKEIPVPLKLYPFVKRLEDFAELTEQEIYNILFIIRLADALVKVGYATFLTHSLVDELKKKLEVNDLDLEIEISAMRWTYQQGAIMTYHRIASDYDFSAAQELSRIALGVLEDSITATEGLKKIQRCEERTTFPAFETFYRQFPGRVFVMPLLASTGAVVYFGGTAVDFLVCLVTGTAAGLIHYLCSTHPQLAGLEEILVAASTAILSTISTFLFPASTCFPAQVLGSLFCFLWGVSFVLSLYEITQNLVMTGLARFCLATMKTFVLAFGVVIGLWAADWVGGLENPIMSESMATCSGLDYAINPIWFNLIYPAMAVGSLMHLRVSYKHWPICLMTQLMALKSQYYLSVLWHQPIFVSNFIPAFLATVTAHVLIVTLNNLNLTKLDVKPSAFLIKKLKPRRDIKEPLADLLESPSSPGVLRFVDRGWADQGDTREGYRRNKLYQYQRSDLWFCLVPSLYLLVPGAAIWRVAFFSIVESPSSSSTASFESLASGVFVVGMALVLGLRLALAALWTFNEMWRRLQTFIADRADADSGGFSVFAPLLPDR